MLLAAGSRGIKEDIGVGWESRGAHDDVLVNGVHLLAFLVYGGLVGSYPSLAF